MRIILLGTGTSVGKTFVAFHLARALAARDPSRPLLALKPIETGVVDPARSDAAQLAKCAHLAPCPSPHPLFSFVPALSPHLAAARAGTRITTAAVTHWLNRVTLPYSTLHLILETPGAVFSPLGSDAANFDLALALEPAFWLLVAPDAIGVLHDVRATLLAMRARGRSPDRIVLSAARDPDASTGTNALELASLGICRVDALLPRDDPSPIDNLAEGLLRQWPA